MNELARRLRRRIHEVYSRPADRGDARFGPQFPRQLTTALITPALRLIPATGRPTGSTIHFYCHGV